MKKLFALLLTMAMVLSLAACSGNPPAENGAGTDTPDTTDDGVQSPDAAEDQGGENTLRRNEIVRIGFPSAYTSFFYAPILVSQQMGYFDDEGIDIVCEQSYSSSATRMVASNQSEFSVPGPHLTAAGIDSGMDIVSVYQLFPIDVFGFAVMADSGMTSVKDLEGKTIGTMTPTTANQVNPILGAAGIDPESVTLVPINDARAQQLSEGTVDAVWTWNGEWEQWKAEGMDIAFLSGEEVYQSASNSIIASTKLVEEYPELIEGFCRALAKGCYFCYKNPRAAADIVITNWTSLAVDLDTAEEIINTCVNVITGGQEVMEGTSMGEHSEEKWGLLMDDYVKYGIVSEYIDLERCYTNQFVEAANDWDRAAVEADAESYQFVTQ